MSLRLSFALMVVVAGLLEADAQSPRKVALVVGVQAYDHRDLSDLNYAAGDAARLSAALKDVGFTVTLMTAAAGQKSVELKPTAANIRAQAERLSQGLTKRDLILVALTGHGLQPSGASEAYFCPQDANPTLVAAGTGASVPQDPNSLIGLDQLLKQIHSRGVGQTLFLVDACRNEPLQKGAKSARKGIESIVFNVPEQAALLLSCSKGEFSFELEGLGDPGSGVFFHYVIEGLTGKAADPEDGIVTWDALTNYVKRRVAAKVTTELGSLGGQQTPSSIGHLEGSISLATIRPLTPPLQPPPEMFDATRPRSATEANAAQRAWAKSLGKPVIEKNTIGMELVLIPPGDFWMGSEETKADLEKAGFTVHFDISDESPRHRVRISRPFQLARTEVTLGQFRAFVNATGYQTEAERDTQGGWGYNAEKKGSEQNPRYHWRNTGWTQTDDHPVVNVTWNDAQKFVEWLSETEGREYRLPTEAEWEYACRAGSQSRFWTGVAAASVQGAANVQDQALEAKFPGVDFQKFPSFEFDDGVPFTAAVGRFRSNGFGLADMTGNVWEWCADVYDAKVYGRTSGLATDPVVTSGGSSRVIRGGGWYGTPVGCRSAFRNRGSPAYRYYSLGFRPLAVQSR